MYCVFWQPRQPVQACTSNVCVNVEVVSGKKDTQRGLQGRKGLGYNRGMLFVFDHDDRYRFWMKGMKFPIDILWLNSDGRIVAVGENVPPCAADPSRCICRRPTRVTCWKSAPVSAAPTT